MKILSVELARANRPKQSQRSNIKNWSTLLILNHPKLHQPIFKKHKILNFKINSIKKIKLYSDLIFNTCTYVCILIK